jgi:protein ImuA
MSDFRAGRLAAMRAKIAAIETERTGRFWRPALRRPADRRLLPGGGLPLGRWHEITGPGMEVETAAAPAAFTALLAAPWPCAARRCGCCAATTSMRPA